MLSRSFGLAASAEPSCSCASWLCDRGRKRLVPGDPEFRSAFIAYLESGTRDRRHSLQCEHLNRHGDSHTHFSSVRVGEAQRFAHMIRIPEAEIMTRLARVAELPA